MNERIAAMNSGITIYDKMSWGESEHFEAVSLLYDICIYCDIRMNYINSYIL